MTLDLKALKRLLEMRKQEGEAWEKLSPGTPEYQKAERAYSAWDITLSGYVVPLIAALEAAQASEAKMREALERIANHSDEAGWIRVEALAALHPET